MINSTYYLKERIKRQDRTLLKADVSSTFSGIAQRYEINKNKINSYCSLNSRCIKSVGGSFSLNLQKSNLGGRQFSVVCSVKGFKYWLSSGSYSSFAGGINIRSWVGYGSVSNRPKTRTVTHYSRGPIAKKKFSLVPVGFWKKPMVGELRMSRYVLSTQLQNKKQLNIINSGLVYISGLVSHAGGSAARCNKIVSFLSSC